MEPVSPRCQHCKKVCKPSDLKKVELRDSFDKEKAVWSKPKEICLNCLRKNPINGNYRVVMERGKSLCISTSRNLRQGMLDSPKLRCHTLQN